MVLVPANPFPPRSADNRPHLRVCVFVFIGVYVLCIQINVHNCVYVRTCSYIYSVCVYTYIHIHGYSYHICANVYITFRRIFI